jgi:uncharacterized RDD family membrane protein YckC
MENTPQGSPANPEHKPETASEVNLPTSLLGSVVAAAEHAITDHLHPTPVHAEVHAEPVTPAVQPANDVVTPPLAATVEPATPPVRAWKPIVIEPDYEPEEFDHGHGNRLVLVVRRTLAMLVDTVGVTFLFAIFGFQAMTAGKLPFTQDERGFEMMLAAAFAASLVLLLLFETVTGTSLGKLLFGLHVRTISGKKAGMGRIFVRNLFRVLDVLLIGVLLMLLLHHRQRMGDMASGTTVGRSPIGPFATIAGILLVAGLAWAEVTYGGGLTSIKALTEKVESYAPDLAQRVGIKLPATSASAPVQTEPSPAAAPSPS